MKECAGRSGPPIIVGIFIGAMLTGFGSWMRPGSSPMVFAAASDSTDGLAVATGSVSEDADGVFFLDTTSGQLSCIVFNPQAGLFNSAFRRSVLGDLQLDAGGNSRLLMVAGDVQVPQRTAQSIGGCIVYVVDSTSGRFAAYAVPWRRDLFDSGRAQVGELALLQTGSARDIPMSK